MRTPAKKVLVADDEEDVVRLLCATLQHHGFETITAYEGGEVIEKAERLRPDLILLDIQMPDAVGASVLSRLKSSSKTSRIPIIIVSGLGMDRIVNYAREGNTVDFIPKPFSSKELLQKVENSLGIRASH